MNARECVRKVLLPLGLPEPALIELTWSAVDERVWVALDQEDGTYFTCVFYYDEGLPLSFESHADHGAAVTEVKRLLAGGWRDYFNAQMLGEFDKQRLGRS